MWMYWTFIKILYYSLSSLCTKMSRYLWPMPKIPRSWSLVSFWVVDGFTPSYFPDLAEGPLLYILRTGSGRTDGGDVYGVILTPSILWYNTHRTQLRSICMMTRGPRTGAGGGCWRPEISISGEVTLPRVVPRYRISVFLIWASSS